MVNNRDREAGEKRLRRKERQSFQVDASVPHCLKGGNVLPLCNPEPFNLRGLLLPEWTREEQGSVVFTPEEERSPRYLKS